MKVEFDIMQNELDDKLEIIDDIRADNDPFGSTAVIPDQQQASQASADDRVQVGSLLRDRFLLKEKASGGSMGVVFKALDRRLAETAADEQWVAIKVLSPQLAENAQALRALQQEAAKGRCLAHPNIVRFIDLDREDDLYFLVLEWLDGRTLADILDSGDAASITHDVAMRIVGQIGDALSYAHRCGIVHADVKPANVMIMPNGDAKLFDFGIARVQQKQTDGDFDPAALRALTPAYSSMQVLTGEDPVPADDVFSLACLLYRLLAGHRVFGPRNAAEASEQGMTAQRPQGLSDEFWRALKKALSYSRVMRYVSIDEFMAALRDGTETEEPEPVFENVRIDDRAEAEVEESGGGGKWFVLLVLLLGLAAAGLYQMGFLDQWLEQRGQQPEATGVSEKIEVEVSTDDAAPVVDFAPADSAAGAATELDTVGAADEVTANPLVDFATLPPADLEVSFLPGSNNADSLKITMREDERPVIVDFVRRGSTAAPLDLKLEEIGFSGNRSPWGSGQYSFSDSGFVRFPAGQDRGRVTLTMASDQRREADQLSTLRLRDADLPQSELAIIYVALEDDDQRAFEARLPANTIGFSLSETSIRESDPAVQIELVRFNPDESRAVAEFRINDVTASEGDDYFAPASSAVVFGPGQRSARLLIPLVQDSLSEGDETFVIELAAPAKPEVDGVYQRTFVLIRDDEPQYR